METLLIAMAIGLIVCFVGVTIMIALYFYSEVQHLNTERELRTKIIYYIRELEDRKNEDNKNSN